MLMRPAQGGTDPTVSAAPPRGGAGPDLRRPRAALVAALLATVALGGVYVLATRVGPLQRIDAAALDGFLRLDRPALRPLARTLAHLCDPVPFAAMLAALVAIALLRRRARTALAAFLAPSAAAVTTQLLKPALATERAAEALSQPIWISPASWPSGHATAAMSLALAAVLVAPARWRPLVATLGAAFAVAVTFSFVALGWHFPSDVVGGFLVATAWTLVALAALRWAERRWPAASRSTRRPSLRDALVPPARALTSGALVIVAALLARPHEALAFARDHPTAIVCGALLALSALALATGVSALAARPSRR